MQIEQVRKQHKQDSFQVKLYRSVTGREFVHAGDVSMGEISPIGPHRLFQDGPILMFRHHGNFMLSEATLATTLYSRVISDHGYLLLLLDFTHSGDVDPKTRRHLVDWGKAHAERTCIAVFGSNLVFRTTFTLIVNAIRLLSSTPLQAKACSERHEALAWLKDCGAGFEKRELGRRPRPTGFAG